MFCPAPVISSLGFCGFLCLELVWGWFLAGSFVRPLDDCLGVPVVTLQAMGHSVGVTVSLEMQRNPRCVDSMCSAQM